MRLNWLNVDMDGLRQILVRRGKQFVVYELAQNSFDEPVSEVRIALSRPVRGRSELVVSDDSPQGFRNLADAYTLYGQSYKKADPTKRGCFDCGEKQILALCDEASITTTSGRVVFDNAGRHVSSRTRRERGSEFRGSLRLSIEEWEEVCAAAQLLIPPVPTFFNDREIPARAPVLS